VAYATSAAGVDRWGQEVTNPDRVWAVMVSSLGEFGVATTKFEWSRIAGSDDLILDGVSEWVRGLCPQLG
jgi:hypothetical protein